MGLSDELKIVITGDPSAFNKALAEVKSSTRDLESGLSAAAKISGVAWVALTGAIAGTVAAYAEDEKAQKSLQQVLQSTGRSTQFSAEQLEKTAQGLQDVTLFSKASIVQAESVILRFDKIGKDIFPRVTQTSLDMAQAMGISAPEAARKLGIAMQDPARGVQLLSREGIIFTENQKKVIAALAETGQTAKAQKIILDALGEQFNGAAQAAAKGTGVFTQLQNTFANVAAEIGKVLAPALESAATELNNFLKYLRDNEELLKTVAIVLGITSALAGLVFGLSTGVLALVKFYQVMQAAIAVMGGMRIAVTALAGAAGIGLLLIVITEVATHWDQAIKAMSSIWTNFVNLIKGTATGIGQILVGVFTGDFNKIKQGFEDLKNSTVKSLGGMGEALKTYWNNRNTTNEQGHQEEQKQEKKHKDAMYGINQFYIERLKALEQESKNVRDEQNLTDKQLEELEERKFANDVIAINNKARADEMNATRKFALEKIQQDRQEHTLRAEEEVKYGKALAGARALFRSQEFAATDDALKNLSTLTASHNATLFQIGKDAAYANAVVNVAQGVTRALASYPPPFSFIAAAAQLAAGLVQIEAIQAQTFKYAEGGLVTGGIPGVDSVNARLTPGELIVPTKNYDEVIDAVVSQRLVGQQSSVTTAQGAQRTQVDVTIGFTDNAFQIIEKKLIQRRAVGTGLI